MPHQPDSSYPNPIAEKFAQAADAFLEQQEGREVDPSMREELGELLLSITCEFVGIKEASELLGVTPQRTNQLRPKMPPVAGTIAAGTFWLKEHVIRFDIERQPVRERHMGVPRQR